MGLTHIITYWTDMRRQFAEYLFQEMKTNNKIWLATGDLGYGLWDKIKNQFPERFINVGSAEQLLVDMAIGLKLSGKIPIVYSITPFFLRAFESLRTYVNYERIGIKLVGSGRDQDYLHDGISHWAHDDELLLKGLNNIKLYKPNELTNILDEFLYSENPAYLNLRR